MASDISHDDPRGGALAIRGVSRAAGRLLSRGSILFALIVGVLPNLLFLAAMPFFIAERLISPLLYLIAAIASFFLPRLAVFVLFAIVATVDLGLIVMIAFNLPLAIAIDSLRYMATIDVAASGFYIGLIAATLSTALLSAWLFDRHRAELRSASPLPVTLVAFALTALDLQFNVPYLTKSAPAFDSAASQNGLDADGIAGRGNNLLIVMIEGLGAFADPAERQILAGRLERAAAGRYDLASGTSRYSGSTTGAESRELCGQWGNHLLYIYGAGPFDCLPRRLAARGFETVAYHGYTTDMFARDVWYPKIGFNELHFMDDMVRDRDRPATGRCGSVFLGLCDEEIATRVHRRLLEAGDAPKLVYWLTLNSHVPFAAKPDSPLSCGRPGSVIANVTVCRLAELWGDVFDGIAAIAADPRLPATDILLVGDHHTPLWERGARRRFTFGEVDWYFLRSRQTRGEQQVASRFGPVRPRAAVATDGGF